MLALAWLVMCAQQLILASSTLSGWALESAAVSLAACALWFAVTRLSAAVEASPHPARLVVCGAMSSVAGVLLAFSGGGSWSLLLLFVHVALACEVVSHALVTPSGHAADGAVEVAGGGLVCAAAVHVLARACAALLGASGNVGFYAQVSVVAVSLLPAAAAVAAVLRSQRPTSMHVGGDLGGRGAVAVVGAPALAALLGLFAFMSQVFCGVVVLPYQIDMLACSDRASFAAAVVGAAALVCSKGLRLPGRACSFGLVLLSVAVMLGGMVSYAVAADPVAPLPLAVIQAAGACLIASVWALAPFCGDRWESALAASLVAFAVPARFIGVAVKHAVGLDGRTVIMLSLASTVALAVVLLIAVTVVAVASLRALRAAEVERERAVEGAVESVLEEMRHDSDYARGAMRQVYSDILDGFGLSDREKEIAILVLEGNGTDAIASLADISSSTVRFHLRNIYAKASVKGKFELRDKVNNRLGLPSS